MAEVESILVIDDSEIVLTRIRHALVQAGYRVTTSTQTVGNAKQARSCDLVIVDLHMPGIDGSSVAGSLKSAFGDDERPLLYLYTTDEKANEKSAALGFDGCFTRKGDFDALLPQVQAALRLRRMRRAVQKKRAGV